MIDALQVFDGTISSAGVLAGANITVTRVSTNVLDMGSNRDIGAGGLGLEVVVTVTTAFTAGGAATLTIIYETAVTDFATNATVISSPTYAVADLVAGAKIFRYKVPIFQLNDVGVPNRFHRLTYTVATGPMLTGAVFANIQAGNDREEVVTYARGYTVTG